MVPLYVFSWFNNTLLFNLEVPDYLSIHPLKHIVKINNRNFIENRARRENSASLLPQEEETKKEGSHLQVKEEGPHQERYG